VTAGRSPLPGACTRVIRRAGPRTVRTRVTVAAGLALTTAVLLGLVVMYLIQAGSADRAIASQQRAGAAQVALPRGLAVCGAHVTAGGQRAAIVIGTADGLRGQVNETFTRLLAIGVPGLLVLACGTIWLIVGRALRPVERIRGAAAAITGADLSRRVPEPGTDDEIGHLACTMNDMLARLEDSAARQRRFVADASHELRTPLTAIRTGLEVGLSHPAAAPWPDIARRAVRQSQRLEQLTAQLLLLAKSDAGQLADGGQPVDLHVLLTGLSTAVPGHGASIETAVTPGTATTGNADELSRLFRNLVDNAVRYARRRVLITAPSAAGRIVVEVIDDGPGIPASQRERVFGRFVRLDPAAGRPAAQRAWAWPSPGISRPRTAPPSCSPTPTAAERGAVVTLPRAMDGSAGTTVRSG
jgi:signal transduction histidine kinase